MAAAINDWSRSSPDNTRYAPEKGPSHRVFFGGVPYAAVSRG